MPNDLQSIVAAAKKDAVARGLPAQAISVQSAQRVTWRDGSLGCPKPGYSYTQALVDGYRIVLRAGAEEYVYHGADGQKPFRCVQTGSNGAVGG